MAEARLIAKGDSIDYTPAGAVAAGQVVVVGEVVGVAPRAIAAGELGSLRMTGIHEMAKIGATAIGAGVPVYWDDAANVVTPTAGSLKLIGVCAQAALSADTVVRVIVGRSLGAAAVIETVATPTFDPVAGSYPHGGAGVQVVIATATVGATIRYTTNGSTPTASFGTVYSGPVVLSEDTTLKAIAYKSGMTDSAVATAAYDITYPATTFTGGTSEWNNSSNWSNGVPTALKDALIPAGSTIQIDTLNGLCHDLVVAVPESAAVVTYIDLTNTALEIYGSYIESGGPLGAGSAIEIVGGVAPNDAVISMKPGKTPVGGLIPIVGTNNGSAYVTITESL